MDCSIDYEQHKICVSKIIQKSYNISNHAIFIIILSTAQIIYQEDRHNMYVI